jgi:hypothetical protein
MDHNDKQEVDLVYDKYHIDMNHNIPYYTNLMHVDDVEEINDDHALLVIELISSQILVSVTTTSKENESMSMNERQQTLSSLGLSILLID